MAVIQTPDQRVRVFISSTMKELAAERAAVRAAVERLHLTPVLFELGARPHPPKELYLAYLRQSHVFVGIYHQQYGWIAPGEQVSGLEDEYLAARDKPKLVYVKSPADERDPRLAGMLARIANDGLSYRRFGTPEELAALVVDDLALLLSERFGTRDDGQPPSAPPARIRPLPAPPNLFVGRARELADLHRLLTADGVRLVTLVGPGGIGKTRLALVAADGLRDEFADGVAAVMLAAVASADLVPAAIATELGLPDTFGRSPEEALADFLGPRRMLLLLDNLEHVVGAAPLIARLLAGAPGLRVLATSREVLHLTGERVLPVPPLPVGDPRDPAQCARSEAVQLFVDRARAARAHFELDERRWCLLAEICERLEGLPLAIELAAARVRLLEPEVILRRLDDRLSLLTGGPRDVADRQRALRTTIRWSVDLLDDRERTLFARLGVFAGGFFLDAVERLCGDHERIEEVLDAVTSLADKSLVRAEGAVDGCPHFAMLETVREFAAGMLAGSTEADRVAAAHTDFFERMACASVIGSQTGPGASSWARFAADAGNIRAALRRLQQQGEADRMVAMGEGLWPVWWGWAVFEEGMAWMRAAQELPSIGPGARATADYVRGTLAFGHGDTATSVRALTGARRQHEQLGDRARAACDAILLGIAVSTSDLAAGERLEREAVEVLREHGEPWKYAYALFALGRVLVVGGRTEEAVPLLEDSVRIQRAGLPAGSSGPDPLLGYAVLNLGWARLGLGDVVAARQAFREALAVAGDADPQVRARGLEALAAVALRDGDARLGALLFGAAEGVRRSIGIGVWLTDLASHEQTEAALRGALGDRDFEATVAEGLALPAGEALAVAHDGSTAAPAPAS